MYKVIRCDPGLFEKDLSGRRYVVTGANSGTGLATTAQLVRQGAHVIAACRRIGAGKDAIAHLTGERGSAEVIELDLSSLASVRRFVEALQRNGTELHGLVNNAGVMNSPKGRTADGFETQFSVNYLGHFLLTELLLDMLRATAPSRVVCVSSVAHAGFGGYRASIDLADVHFDKRTYNGMHAYCQSKLAIVVYARYLAKRLAGTGVSVFSTHPGWIRSNLVKPRILAWVQNILLRPFGPFITLMSAEDGAQTQLHCLLDDDAPNHSGEYYSQNGIIYPDKRDRPGGWPMRSPNPLVYDDVLAERLYDMSRRLVGL